MRGSEFISDCVDSLYYKNQKIRLNRGGMYIDSLKWPKNKKATVNRKNNDDKCFQYAIIVALNHGQIKSHLERISNIRSIISNKKNWNVFEKKQKKTKKAIALNTLYLPHNTEKIRHVYKSKHILKRKNQVILLIITDGEKWHYLAVKKLSALLRRIISNHVGDFYCLNCLHSYRTEDHNNPERSLTTKKYKHTPSGYSMFTHCSFDASKNKLDFYRDKDCMEIFCKDLKEYATKLSIKKRK